MLDNPTFNAGHLLSIGVAVATWAWFFLLVVARVRRAGIAYEEPVLWLYGTPIRVVRIVSFLLLVGVGFLLPPGDSPTDIVDAVGVPLGLGLGAGFFVVALFAIPLTFFLRWRRKLQDVVYEPPSAAQMLMIMVLATAGLASAMAIPVVLSLLLGTDVPTLLERIDPAAALAPIASYLVLWFIPSIVGWLDMENDRDRVWVDSTGLVAFRWTVLGLLLLLVTGPLARIPGPDILVSFPAPFWLPLLIAPMAGVFYVVFWMLPILKLQAAVAEEDFLALERIGACRMLGAPVYLSYQNKSRIRGRVPSEPDKASKTCPTCLKPIDRVGDYYKLKFDACPHCGNFIPPIFNVHDYLNFQNEKLVPVIEEANTPGKKKKVRREQETRYTQELLHTLISVAVAERGTDVHMAVEGDEFLIRCRTDGVMRTLCSYDKIMERPVLNALKVISNLDITERRKPQDGSFKMELLGRNVDVRVNTSPVPGGEMAAARLLYSRGELSTLKDLGMTKRNERQTVELIRRASGLIAVVGPTGSGKSTTLYNCLESISTGDRNIITLEDPIEYKIDGVSQMQVNQAKGFTFATGLRSILRQDPDVIMVGEIRDGETATMAINAAATGHLVFTTLHSPDSVGAIGRLSDLGIEAQRYASSTLAILSQRLVRLNCRECSEEALLSREQLDREALEGAPEEIFHVRVSRGCPACRDTGFFGREGIYEFFVPDEPLRNMMAEKVSLPALRREARTRGMRTLLEDGLSKVLLGHTTLEEVLRVAR